MEHWFPKNLKDLGDLWFRRKMVNLGFLSGRNGSGHLGQPDQPQLFQPIRQLHPADQWPYLSDQPSRALPLSIPTASLFTPWIRKAILVSTLYQAMLLGSFLRISDPQILRLVRRIGLTWLQKGMKMPTFFTISRLDVSWPSSQETPALVDLFSQFRRRNCSSAKANQWFNTMDWL